MYTVSGQGTPFHAGGREPLGKIPTSVPIEALRGVQGPSPWSDPWGECCSGKENLDDIRGKPFQAIHKHILARKPHTCLLEIQDVPQSRNGPMGSMICSILFYSILFYYIILYYIVLYSMTHATSYRQQSPKQPTHTDKKTHRYIPQATDSNLPSPRLMGVCRLLRRLVGSLWNVSVCFYRCASVAWVVASWVGGCKENLDDIRAKPFQAIHKHILARKPHTCPLEIQDVPLGLSGPPWA